MSSDPAILGGQPAFDYKVPLTKPVLHSSEEMAAGRREIYHSGIVTKGPFLRQLEREMADHLRVSNAIAVSSCTSALMLVHICLGLSGEVIAPSFTFMATVGSLVRAGLGLRPVFVDVDPNTANALPAAVEAAITPRTSAILAVHNFGNPADISALEDIARRRKLKLIFDAAHGFGSLYKGRPLGSHGAAECFSMSATKLVVAYEGGVIATNDDHLAANLRRGREYGNDGAYNSMFAGINARLSEEQALHGLLSLRGLEAAAQCRNQMAALYKEELAGLPGVKFQAITDGNRSSYKDFSIMVDAKLFGLSRNELALALAAEKIETRSYHSPPAHKQDAYAGFAAADLELPATDMLSERSLSLPIWSVMDPLIIRKISRAIWQIHNKAKAVKMCLNDKRPALSLS